MSAWSEVAPGVLVRQSQAYAMNSTVLLSPEHAVLVDPGVLPSEMDDIATAVQEAGPEHLTLVFTHAHWDHVLGHAWWPGAPSIAHARFAEALQRGEGDVHREAARICRKHGETWDAQFESFRPHLVAFGERDFQLGPWDLVMREAFGHADDQITVHLPAERVLIAADMLSDIELPILAGPCEVYRATLAALAPVVQSGAVETLIPGHGSITRGPAVRGRLNDDARYLEVLETRVREARAQGRTLDEAMRTIHPPLRAGHDAAYAHEIHRHNIAQTWEGLGRSAA